MFADKIILIVLGECLALQALMMLSRLTDVIPLDQSPTKSFHLLLEEEEEV